VRASKGAGMPSLSPEEAICALADTQGSVGEVVDRYVLYILIHILIHTQIHILINTLIHIY
jgi:hypothetical protein